MALENKLIKLYENNKHKTWKIAIFPNSIVAHVPMRFPLISI